ncbi:hypothetical protein ACQ4M3_35385 [Leptolyngbya sp. AN03gr2]|uniref:hypothetical protein n=1 Tax=unclassified Leptolyngbya TaxID=2650499 RepID=UPI003D315C62
MLDTLTLHLDTIQQVSRFTAGTHDRTSDWKNIAEQIDLIIHDVDAMTHLVEEQWDSFSDSQKQSFRDQLRLIDCSLLLPSENLPDRLVQSLSRFEQIISDKIARDAIREGWKDAMTGRTIPIAELWDGLDDE